MRKMHAAPVQLDCNFVVDSTNGNGLGIRQLKGPAVANVLMHTTTTPRVGNNGITNPNPASGLIVVQLSDNYNRYYCGFSGAVSPLTGSALTSTTAGNAYVIISLGTTTNAQWQAAGVSSALTPSFGMSFIAAATGAIGGTGSVKLAGVSGIANIEVIGDPNQSIAPLGTPGQGAQFILQILAPTSSSVTTPIATAPADGSVISLSFLLSNSSIIVLLASNSF